MFWRADVCGEIHIITYFSERYVLSTIMVYAANYLDLPLRQFLNSEKLVRTKACLVKNIYSSIVEIFMKKWWISVWTEN